ncbi:cytochrome P450 [Marasmius fiardii PR-910]|nr:cytochrome P450 [Marasmius fiardii PR-910]
MTVSQWAVEPIIVFALLACTTLALTYTTNRRCKIPLPPSPPGQWILGNLNQMPRHQPWLQFTSWKKQYGDIIHLKLVNKHMIVLNSKKVVFDLLEGRSNIYSQRPRSVLLDQVLDDFSDDVFRVQIDDPRFKAHRRLMHSGLGPRAVREYQPLQIQETNTMLRSLADDPDRFIAHIRRNAGALIMKVAYGYTVSSTDDYYLELIERHFEILGETLALPFMIEFFPILRHIPSWFPFGNGFRKAEQIIRGSDINHIPFAWAKKQVESGDYVDSFFARFFQREDGTTLSQDEERTLMKVCAALYIGGADTTVAALTSFFYLMETHPEIQKRAQAEVDAATGGDRLPCPDDEGKMPYLTAVIKETLRWSPVAPMGLFHNLSQDDIYDGYLIPKDSQILANIWAITHDPENYPNPEVFDPERHLGANPQQDPFDFVFGFGRRSCPGSHLAERSLFQNTANILAVFNIEKKRDSQGKPIEPTVEFHGGITSHLKNFPVKMVVRSPHLLPTA